LGLLSNVMHPHAAPRTTMAMVGQPESETSSGDPPAGPDSRQEHPSLAMPERGGGTDTQEAWGVREAPQHRAGRPSTTRASPTRAEETGLGRSSPAAAAPSSAQGNRKGTRAGWTLNDYVSGVRPQARTPLPPPVDPGAWRLAALAAGTESGQQPPAPASVWQKLRQRRTERQNSMASVQPPELQEQEQFQAPRRTWRQRPPLQSRPIPTPNPFAALEGLSEDVPAQSRQS
jgi:hypothetical protein